MTSTRSPPCTFAPAARAAASAFCIASKAWPSISGPTSASLAGGVADGDARVDGFELRDQRVVDALLHDEPAQGVQRWPAVPMAAKATARSVRSRSADGVTMEALLPPSSSMARPKRRASLSPTARPMRVEPVAETTGTRGSSTSAAPASRPPMSRLTEPVGRVAEGFRRAREDRLDGERGQRGLLGRLPDDAVAADEGERRVPRPHRDGEVERGDDADRADRMPLLDQLVIFGRSEAMVRP